jgi:hypothetical protein
MFLAALDALDEGRSSRAPQHDTRELSHEEKESDIMLLGDYAANQGDKKNASCLGKKGNLVGGREKNDVQRPALGEGEEGRRMIQRKTGSRQAHVTSSEQ